VRLDHALEFLGPLSVHQLCQLVVGIPVQHNPTNVRVVREVRRESALTDVTHLTVAVQFGDLTDSFALRAEIFDLPDEADASGRLREAAMQLYVERGFEQTTVAEIAQRAGLTARTFFRYFADKREVLFAGSADLQEHLVHALDSAPESASPMQAVSAALDAAAAALGQRREYSRQRQIVINANAELRERELIKMASLSTALADGLRRRGFPEPDASLAAEIKIVVLRVAFERWVSEPHGADLPQTMRTALDRLETVTTAR
jgi:AcrR family transcriptional regulator